ncbi:MAG: 1-acyl-sn-glycerol-3-phosphate acyltransferase [Anaerolineae bacterium]|jgi:1-acyl-sn-glycerol-3-phosphate acyltransferase|nr:1-acyl-sn-glycerol-3-phosphate acyltransferase [Anaerolineae bacterium]
MTEPKHLRYPRRQFVRNLLRLAGRAVGALAMRTQVIGRENLPTKGPLILVGNHIAVVEVGLMATYTPYNLEIMAAGDIPLDPRYQWMADLWGIIPIKRGSMDRDGMNKALDVLNQGGVVGLFPEGGIWETTLRQARQGVAWLSNKGQAPVVPIGFGGIEGALAQIARFRRPRLTMNIGKPIPPVQVDVPGKSRKELLQQGADYIMDRISELIPEDERRIRTQPYIGETFDFKWELTSPDGVAIAIPAEVEIVDKHGLSKLFHRPVMMDVFNRNLKLPVRPLVRLRRAHSPLEIAASVHAILTWLSDNPYFFHYRFGHEEGEAMMRGLRQLQHSAQWLGEHYPSAMLRLKPIRRYILLDTNQEVIEDAPAEMQEM